MIDLREKLKGREGFITAVDAMIGGLKSQNKRADFVVDMCSFGEVHYFEGSGRKTCVGCAATCAVQELFNLDFDSTNIGNCSTRAAAINVLEQTAGSFEEAIDDLRIGNVLPLTNFCQLEAYDHLNIEHHFQDTKELTYENWRDALYEYEIAIDEVKIDWGLSAPGN